MSQRVADTFIRYEVDGKEIEIAIERLSICGLGRSSSNKVVLADAMASREHAMLRRNATGHCILNDLGSTNGTRLNGRPVTTPTELKSGDVIHIGAHLIEFVQTSEPTAISEPQVGDTQFLLKQQLVSVIVADMRNYTRLSAEMGHEATGEMMGEIFREIGERLKQTNCWSTKFIGDAVMGLWIHSGNSMVRDDIVQAFNIISEYQEVFRVAERKFRPPQPLRFGCGYNAGTASIGNLGAAGAADFTAMGEAVNTAFHLETATKQIGCDVLISQAVFDAVSDIRLEPADLVEVEVKGHARPLTARPLRFDQIGGFLGLLLAAK